MTDVLLTSLLLYLSKRCPSPSQSLEDGVSSSSTMGVCRDVEVVGIGAVTVVGALDVEGDEAFGVPETAGLVGSSFLICAFRVFTKVEPLLLIVSSLLGQGEVLQRTYSLLSM